jgi:hypothetical protein
VNDVVIRLKDKYDLDIAEKTIYGWESDQSYPRTESLLTLCELYRFEDISDGLCKDPSGSGFRITMDERSVIMKYRRHPELRDVVKRMLNMPEEKGE